ncbi:putative FAD-linked oxidoreductase YvdP [Cytospora mali]|uniref:FAD-linked oxidoreductase YvdP n=1 Tax=Cytospora mali TaxID=578113 RepID=A0A194V4T4_CYTMA|nr:putative FAD-linked oxidoreductase YvdP [Valsa mali var. pyri (nom. inval.)]
MYHRAFLTVLLLSVSKVAYALEDAKANLGPVFQNVASASVPSNVDYFTYESTQLTSTALANLTFHNSGLAELVSFGDATETARVRKRTMPGCKVMPGDASWPNVLEWETFNRLLGDSLIQGVPAAAVCYPDWPQYDEGKCSEVTDGWTDPAWQAEQAAGIDYPLFEGVTCVPPSFGRYNADCTLGGYPAYIVNVTNVAQIQLAVNFARNLNLRLNVKNKGHDFNAKSTGAGALSIWLNHLQDIKYLVDEYASATVHIGPAFKIGTGVSVGQINEAADKHGVQVVGAIARTIGIGGGYIAGGGNSPLISKYGLAADQVISMQVVLPDGRFVSADEKMNPDLFFALRGGGGSTWGIVTSLVIRAYAKTPITTLTYNFGTGVEPETFWSGINALFEQFPSWPKATLYSYWSIACSNATSCSMYMAPQIGPDMNTTELETLNAPLFANLSSLGIPVNNLNYTTYNTYLEAFDAMWPHGSISVGGWTEHTATRLFPASNWEDPNKLAATIAAIRNSSITHGYFLAYNVQPAVNPAVNQTNAVNPAWRETLLFAMLGATWGQNVTAEEISEANRQLVEALQPWREVSPQSGTYLNEADINEPNWQQAFYGENYGYLYELKQKYDPWGLLYAATAVGSEDWYVTNQTAYYPTQNGRLCPVA